MHVAPVALLAVCGLALMACGGGGPGPRLTPAEQSDFADTMTRPNPLTSGQIPAADPLDRN